MTTRIRPLVLKFGGTSLEDAPAMARAADIVSARKHLSPVVVVSAMSKVTDALLAAFTRAAAAGGDADAALDLLAPHFARHLDAAQSLVAAGEVESFSAAVGAARLELAALLREAAAGARPRALLQDAVVAHGERLSSTLFSAVLRAHGLASETVDARRCVITNDEHTCAAPAAAETERRTRAALEPLLAASIAPVLGGFIGSTHAGETTTLGRGGSDYSAAVFGAALSASEIQIWTDVTGVLTADPRVVAAARTVPRMSYAEAAELAYFGAKVLHPKTILPAVVRGIPVRICNSRRPGARDTVIYFEPEATTRTVKAIAHKTGVSIVHVTSARMLGAYGFLRQLFEVFERHRTIVDVVTTSEVSVSMSVEGAGALDAILADLRPFAATVVERGRAIICVVGEGLRWTPGIAGRVFSTISDINVLLISQGASNVNLTFAVEEARAVEAVRRLHAAFFEGEAGADDEDDEEDSLSEMLDAAAEARGVSR
ncbi:MAG: lysine-sensitive aspartokinase 3 [Acidobacteria bacterium]|nr:lysine-sensitive aspartokinase 3 [Acidobacteriota bacterium]